MFSQESCGDVTLTSIANLCFAASSRLAVAKYSVCDSVIRCQRYGFDNRCGYGGEKQENKGDEEKDCQRSGRSKHCEGG